MANTPLTEDYNPTKPAADDGILNSSFVPAYPQTTSSTVYNEAFYWQRQQAGNELIGPLTLP